MGRIPRISSHRSEEHTSELQSLRHLVCRLLLEKKIARKNSPPDAELSCAALSDCRDSRLPSRRTRMAGGRADREVSGCLVLLRVVQPAWLSLCCGPNGAFRRRLAHRRSNRRTTMGGRTCARSCGRPGRRARAAAVPAATLGTL